MVVPDGFSARIHILQRLKKEISRLSGVLITFTVQKLAQTMCCQGRKTTRGKLMTTAATKALTDRHDDNCHERLDKCVHERQNGKSKNQRLLESNILPLHRLTLTFPVLGGVFITYRSSVKLCAVRVIKLPCRKALTDVCALECVRI